MDSLRCRLPQPLLALLLTLLLTGPAWTQPGGALSDLSNRQQRPTPLPLAEAFPFYVSASSPGQLQVTWDPAAGHYLYRHAFAFSLQTAAGESPIPLSFRLPDGLHKSDRFFGDIEAYYGNVTATVSLPDGVTDAQLWIEYQGCADWGFCYPPQRTAFALTP